MRPDAMAKEAEKKAPADDPRTDLQKREMNGLVSVADLFTPMLKTGGSPACLI